MNRIRRNVFLEREHSQGIDRLAAMARKSKSQIVAAALADYLSPDGAGRRVAEIVKRLEKLNAQLEHIERDQVILIETLALFIRHHFAITPPIADSHQDAARAQGKLRYQQFIDQLARHLQGGQSLVRDVFKEIVPPAESHTNGSPGVHLDA